MCSKLVIKCSTQAVHHLSVSDDTVLCWLKKYPFLTREIRDQQDVSFAKFNCLEQNKTNKLTEGQKIILQENTMGDVWY